MITGNTGYVGSVLVPWLALRRPDWKLTGFDAGFFAHCIIPSQPIPERFLTLQILNDLRKISKDDLRDVDSIVHLASLSNDPISNYFDVLTQSINVESGFRLAELAKSVGVKRFVFASSCSVYGKASEVSRTENDKTEPLTPYARSKIELENKLEQIADSRFEVVILRFATAYGFSPRLRIDLVLNDFVVNAVLKNQIEILSDGTPWRPLIHVNDMSRAILWALETSKFSSYLIVNVGSEERTFQVHEIAKNVALAVPGTKIYISNKNSQDTRSYKVDFSKFKNLAPDFQPIDNINHSISEIKSEIEVFTNGYLNGNLNFKRLDEILRLQSTKLLNSELSWT